MKSAAAKSTAWAQGWKIDPTLFTETLAGELYKDKGACLWEVVRNGACACMNEENWEPEKAFVEIFLVKNHPLSASGRALVILDHGVGLTDPRVDRYLFLGTPREERRSGRSALHHGAAQKRIGRLATFALRETNDDGRSGFYILTRTTVKGQVRMISIPDIELGTPPEVREVDEAGVELGPQKGIKGSFTAIVVPDPVFTSYVEIREALKWRIPRIKDKMFRLLIGGEQLDPPPLADRILPGSDLAIQACIERTEDGDGGLWIADAETGLRVAYCPHLGSALPYPLFSHGLTGDIFVRSVLTHQNSARDSLSDKFLKSAAWRKDYAYLGTHISPPAQALFEGQDVFERNSLGSQVMELVEMFGNTWGIPTLHGDGPTIDLPGKKKPGGGGGSGGGGGVKTEKKDPKPRSIPVKIGEATYLLIKRPLGPTVLASLAIGNREIIHLNIDGYELWPKSKPVQREHLTTCILEAVAIGQSPSDAEGAREFRATLQRELLLKQKKK